MRRAKSPLLKDDRLLNQTSLWKRIAVSFFTPSCFRTCVHLIKVHRQTPMFQDETFLFFLTRR
jgi:hypothetical protein